MRIFLFGTFLPCFPAEKASYTFLSCIVSFLLFYSLLFGRSWYWEQHIYSSMYLLQPLDLTVSGHCKSFMKGMFAEWYRKQVEEALSHGKKVEDIEVKFYLTVIKHSHAKWLMEFYNHITSEKGSEIIINDWKRSWIYEAVKNGSSSLLSIDPFNEIAPLVVTEKSN